MAAGPSPCGDCALMRAQPPYKSGRLSCQCAPCARSRLRRCFGARRADMLCRVSRFARGGFAHSPRANRDSVREAFTLMRVNAS